MGIFPISHQLYMEEAGEETEGTLSLVLKIKSNEGMSPHCGTLLVPHVQILKTACSYPGSQLPR